MTAKQTLVTVKVLDIVIVTFGVRDKLNSNKTSKQLKMYNIYCYEYRCLVGLFPDGTQDRR